MNRETQRLLALGLALAGTAAGSACGETPRDPHGAAAGTWSRQNRVSGEYLVTVAALADEKAITDLYGRFGIKSIRNLGKGVFLVTLTEDPGPSTMEKLRAGNRQIEAVQPNYAYRTGEPKRAP